MRKLYRYVAVVLSVLFFMQSPMVAYAIVTPGEVFDFVENTFSYLGTQLGVFWSGSSQELILNNEALKTWYADRYAEGFDGTPWNMEDYYTKECIRNPDGTFTISDRMVDDFVAYTKEILDTNSGYYLFKTKSAANVDPSMFFQKTMYDRFIALLGEHKIVHLQDVSFDFCKNVSKTENYIDYYPLDGFTFVAQQDPVITFGIFNKNWESCKTNTICVHASGCLDPGRVFNIESLDLGGVYTKNGDYIKIFKTYNAMKNDNTGHQAYYAGDKFMNYDSSQDNSVTVDEKTYNNTNWSSTNSSYYNNVSNTIINNNYGGTGDSSSAGMTEEQLRQIVNDLMDKIQQGSGDKDDPGGSDGSGGTGTDPGGSGGTGGGIGAGIAAIMEGLGKLLDFLLTVIGKLVGVLSDFLTKAVNLLGGLSGLTAPFANLLNILMPFIPPELWDVIIAGIILSVIGAVVRSFKG